MSKAEAKEEAASGGSSLSLPLSIAACLFLIPQLLFDSPGQYVMYVCNYRYHAVSVLSDLQSSQHFIVANYR